MGVELNYGLFLRMLIIHSEIHRCFTCKRTDPSTLRCTEPDCGRFYHPACLPPTRSLVAELKGSRVVSRTPPGVGESDRLDTALRPGYCPLHVCRTCLLGGATGAEAADGKRDRGSQTPVRRVYILTNRCNYYIRPEIIRWIW